MTCPSGATIGDGIMLVAGGITIVLLVCSPAILALIGLYITRKYPNPEEASDDHQG